MIKSYLTDDIITVSSNNKKDKVSINIKNEDNLYETIIEFQKDKFELKTIENLPNRNIIICTGFEKEGESIVVCAFDYLKRIVP